MDVWLTKLRNNSLEIIQPFSLKISVTQSKVKMLLLIRMFSTLSCEYLSMILYHADHLKILQKLTSFSSLLFFSKKIDKDPLPRTWNIWTKFGHSQGCSLRLQLYLIFFYWIWILINLQLNYIFFFIFFMFAKFPENQISIVMSSIKYLNFKFL